MSTVVPLAAFADAVWRDVQDVVPELGEPGAVRVVLLDDDIPPEVARAVPAAASWRDPTVRSDPQVLLLAGGGTTALDASVDDVPGLHVEIASRLQDLVMDVLGTPWPVVSTEGGVVVVVEPAVIGGRAWWASRGRAQVEFGRLRDAPRS